MKILIVEDDDALRSLLAKQLEERGYDIRQSFRGDEAFYIWQHEGPWRLVLSDHRFIPGTKIKDGAQLVTAIHEVNPSQKMAIMTAEPEEAREKLPQSLRHLPVLRKPFSIEQVLRLLREPVPPL
jgi:two-component system, cell cycle sensor histidine kinase and response regulator CckA